MWASFKFIVQHTKLHVKRFHFKTFIIYLLTKRVKFGTIFPDILKLKLWEMPSPSVCVEKKSGGGGGGGIPVVHTRGARAFAYPL